MVHMKDGKYFCQCGQELGPKEAGQWFCDKCKKLYYTPDEPITLMKWIKKEKELSNQK